MNKQTEIIPFHPEHLKLMDIRDHEVDNVLSIHNFTERIEALIETGVSGTIIYDGRILGAMGTFEMWKGVCEVWVIPCKNISEHGIVFARVIKKYLKNLIELDYYNRIQVTALDDELHNRFFQWLGFVIETPWGMKNFSANKDIYNMWSITKEN